MGDRNPRKKDSGLAVGVRGRVEKSRWKEEEVSRGEKGKYVDSNIWVFRSNVS